MERQAKLSSHLTMPFSHPALQKPHFISFQATLQQFFYTQQTLPHRNFYTQKPEALAHRSFFHKEILDKDDFTHSNALLPAFFLHTVNFDTETLLHTETFTQRNSDIHQTVLLHREAFIRSFCTQKLLHTETVYRQNLLHRSFHTKEFLHRKKIAHSKFLHRGVSTQRNSYTQKLLHRTVFTQDCVNNCKSKIGSRRQSRKKHDFEGFLLNF